MAIAQSIPWMMARGADSINNTLFTANGTVIPGYLNVFNATSGALVANLPQLSITNPSAWFVIQKSAADLTLNTVTVTPYSGDTFYDGAASKVINQPGSTMLVQRMDVYNTGVTTSYWKVMALTQLPTGLLTATSEFNGLQNVATLQTIISSPLPAGLLAAGSSFEIEIAGSIQTSGTSKTLTITPTLQGQNLVAATLTTPAVANAESTFWLKSIITCRSTGTSGTATAKTNGYAALATSGMTPLTGVAHGAAANTTVNTTSAASNSAVGINGQWSAAAAADNVWVEVATIKRAI